MIWHGDDPPARQRGMVFLLFLVAIAVTMATLMGGMLRLFDPRAAAEREQSDLLRSARELLIADLLAPDADQPPTGRRLGQWRLLPDLPIPPGPGADATEPNYDGLAETAGCASQGWAPMLPVMDVSVFGSSARCFGRLPWRDLGLRVDDDGGRDIAGKLPWLVVSPNLAAPMACLRDLNPLALGSSYIGYACPSNPPYPWIKVLDERGNLLSDRVAFALILPGTPLAGQDRTAAYATPGSVIAPPSAYLDTVTVASGCAMPCQPGTYSNAAFNHLDGQPTVLIRAPVDEAAAERSGNYATPYRFNDRIAFVTADELFLELERRARGELIRALLAFRAMHGHFPYASPLASGGGDCASGTRLGHVPVVDGSCGAGRSLTMPSWFTDAGWHRYFVYAASPTCVQSNPVCSGPGLTVGTRTDIRALIIAPRAAITASPYAPSRGAAQTPVNMVGLSGLLSDYLDDAAYATPVPDVFIDTANASPPINDLLVVVE